MAGDVKCGTFRGATITPDVRARMDADRAVAERAAARPWKGAWLAFDTEATGGSARARIVSVGIVLFSSGKPVSTFLEHFNPGPIDWSSGEVRNALRVNGLRRDFLEAQPPLASRWPSVLRAFSLADVWVGHGSRFDLRMLRAERAAWDASTGRDSTPMMPRAAVLDTITLDTVLRPDARARNLAAVCERWQVPLHNAHTADADALACGLLLARMAPLLPDRLDAVRQMAPRKRSSDW